MSKLVYTRMGIVATPSVIIVIK